MGTRRYLVGVIRGKNRSRRNTYETGDIDLVFREYLKMIMYFIYNEIGIRTRGFRIHSFTILNES